MTSDIDPFEDDEKDDELHECFWKDFGGVVIVLTVAGAIAVAALVVVWLLS